MKTYYQTDPGKVRSHNEDSVNIIKNLNDEYLVVVADGMGYDLNWGNVDKEELLEASILSVDNYKVLIGILEDCVE